MRLIDTKTLEIKEFVHPPRYAILSHCWGENEVSFKEYSKGKNKDGAGYKKIRECCDYAKIRGQQWVWIDTCCIDKRSSAELSEAVNSMYKWYEGAEECYAYLADVSWAVTLEKTALDTNLKNSRWFTRGWTLQELIAPSVVIFLDSDWIILGEKRMLPGPPQHLDSSEDFLGTRFVCIIADITGLPIYVLEGRRSDLSDHPAGLRISWLSGRDTTRPEDLAYCMLGLLEINVPLLYGEGREKAFQRVLLEVLRISGDESLFWRPNLIDRFLNVDLSSDSATRLERLLLAQVERMIIHDRPTPIISSDFIEVRMTHARRGVFHHREKSWLYAIRLNCISTAETLGGSPCVMFVMPAGCRPDHFKRVLGVSAHGVKGATINMPTEDDIAEPGDWVPRESDKTMYIHLQDGDSFTCRSDPIFSSQVIFRLGNRNWFTDHDVAEPFETQPTSGRFVQSRRSLLENLTAFLVRV